MKKSIKFIMAMLLLILGILQISSMVFASPNIPAATSDFYVNDFAGVFSDTEKARLMENAVKFADNEKGIQVVVTTVKSLDGESIENYAVSMYNQYGIGKNDAGLLILLSTGDRDIRVEVGYGLEGYFNDAKAGRFIDDYAIPYLKNNNFSGGLINLQEAFIRELTAQLEGQTNTVTRSSTVASDTSAVSINAGEVAGVVLFITFVLFIIFVISYIIHKIISGIKKTRSKVASLEEKLYKAQSTIDNLHKSSRTAIDEMSRKMDRLSDEKNTLYSKYKSLQQKYDTLDDRYKRVQRLYPSADREVSDMIAEEIRQRDLKLAREVDTVIGRVINLSPNKDIVSNVSDALDEYSRLSDKQKSYVESDVSKLRRLYDDSCRLRDEYLAEVKRQKNMKAAETAAASILALIASISVGKSRHLRTIKEAKSIYDNLGSGPRKYFDRKLEDRLDTLYREAKRDKEREEEEERRRRTQKKKTARGRRSSSQKAYVF